MRIPNRAPVGSEHVVQGRSGRVRPTGSYSRLIRLVVLAAVVPDCQQSQSVSARAAIAIADRQVDFKPGPPRSGCSDRASTGSPSGSSPCRTRSEAPWTPGLHTARGVQIDANTGKVEDVNNEAWRVQPAESEEGQQRRPRLAGIARGDAATRPSAHLLRAPGVFSSS